MFSNWSGRGVTFTKSGLRSKGIHKTIKNIFAPFYNYKNLKNKPTNIGGLNLRQAKKKGKLIDRQLSSSNKTSLCKETKALLAKLKELNLSIIETQYTVANEETRLATQIDMIVKHKETSVIYLIETKYSCAYRNCFIENLQFQTTKVNDSLLHQHQLQILIGRWLYNALNVGVLLIYINTDLSIDIITEDQFEAKLTIDGINALKKNAQLTNVQLKRKAYTQIKKTNVNFKKRKQ